MKYIFFTLLLLNCLSANLKAQDNKRADVQSIIVERSNDTINLEFEAFFEPKNQLLNLYIRKEWGDVYIIPDGADYFDFFVLPIEDQKADKNGYRAFHLMKKAVVFNPEVQSEYKFRILVRNNLNDKLLFSKEVEIRIGDIKL
ncbi:MAG: hypothetical protein N4A72_12895 [Bacteroidales bacterium]|jgi:hypothetical protein|nr:hypothetical protein [Bacteroidales bacterium]